MATSRHTDGTGEGTAPFSFEEMEEILLYFSTSIQEKDTEEDILWDLVQNCIARLRFEDCVVYLLDNERQVLVQMAAHGPKSPRGEGISQPIDIPLGKGITGAVAQSGQAEIVGDTSLDARYIVDDSARLSEITVPIVYRGAVLGVIDCEHSARHFFTGQHLRILTAIAAICAMKLDRLRAEKKAQAEQKRRQAVQRQMEEMRAKALKVQMNPHFLFNALNAIQYFIASDDRVSALSYLAMFGKLIRYRLANFQEDMAFLDQEVTVAGWYLKLQKMRYTDKFDYVVDTPGLPWSREIKIPALILPFLLESAVEQAVLHQTAGHVHLTIATTPAEVRVTLSHSLRQPEAADPQRAFRHREGIEPWEVQMAQLNALGHYGVRQQTAPLQDTAGHAIGVTIQIDIPILT